MHAYIADELRILLINAWYWYLKDQMLSFKLFLIIRLFGLTILYRSLLADFWMASYRKWTIHISLIDSWQGRNSLSMWDLLVNFLILHRKEFELFAHWRYRQQFWGLDFLDCDFLSPIFILSAGMYELVSSR